jgi:hypothetical protein
VPVTDYETYGPPREIYDRLRLGRLGVPRRVFQRAYNAFDYARHRLLERIALYPSEPAPGSHPPA